ncbi:MAG TPA: 5'-nucleotidase C-terminal domain-containing protein [Bacillales bacterium]|nr:5'-nucleotidase C-terminal domain-containing protein [Bacillales bacterium]
MFLRFRKIVPAAFLALFLAASPALAQGNKHHPNDNWKHRLKSVQILGINDLHGQLDVYRTVNGQKVGGAAYLAAYLKKYEQKNKNTLLVNAGDSVGASAPVSALLEDQPTIEFMNKMHFDVGTLGNHEFDEGVHEMLRLIYGGYSPKTGYFEGANFPYICANVVYKDTGETVLPPYVIKKVNGMPIGFIGVVTTETPNIVVPSGIAGVKFVDEATAINKAAAQLEKRGVHAIVVLAHDSASSWHDGTHAQGRAVQFASKINDDVDVIFAGHNHDYANTTVDGKLIVEAYSYGTAFSDVQLKIDPKTKDIVSKKAKVITTYHDGIQPDPEIKKLVQHYEQKVAPLVNRVIGTAAESITQQASPAGESALGDLVADSQKAQMNTDFAFMNSGGIRADLNAGDITWGELYTILPFNDQLVKMTLTGEQIKNVLEQQWSGDYPKILQISGLHYTWDENAPVGNKVTSITKADGTPLQMDQTYTVTANSFISQGGDGFTVFENGQNQVTGPTDLEALVEYIQNQQQPISQSVEGRIQVQ